MTRTLCFVFALLASPAPAADEREHEAQRASHGRSFGSGSVPEIGRAHV